MKARAALAAALLAAALVAVPAVAMAQSASAVPTSAIATTPLPRRAPDYKVLLWPSMTGTSIAVHVSVATETPLPVRIRIPFPQGAKVEWVGEIVGQTTAEDIERTYRLVNDGKVLEMVLTTSRVAQLEATLPAPRKERDLLIAELVWVQSVPASGVSFAAKVPADLKDVTVTPVSKYAPTFDAAGDRLYVVDERKMKVGEEYTYSVSFAAARSSTAGAQPADGGRTTVILVLLAAVAVAIVVLLFVMRRQAASKGR